MLNSSISGPPGFATSVSSMSRSLDGKIFMLGIGAQKAGTSWLHDYFKKRRDVFVPPVKELHHFDARFRSDLCSDFDRRFRERYEQFRARDGKSRAAKQRLEILEARVRMIGDESAYRAYFEKAVPKTCRIFGEITPAYSLLPEEGFRAIASQFPRTRLIFLMRDPVDRLYSHLRMAERLDMLTVPAIEQFAAALKNPQYVERSEYHRTLANARRVFAPEDIFTGFYETFFCDAELARLCDFLGIPFKPGDYGTPVNVSPHETRLDAERIAMARKKLAPVYDFCRAEFGDKVPDSWLA